ncbi:MAG: sensor histidine kinase [Lachnospiraceae bacterium]|nr:sensor histidine kinase [Lachnospiraceae bacterium]
MNGTEAEFAIWESVLYAFLNSFPQVVLVAKAFKSRLRFQAPLSFVLMLLASLCYMIVTPLGVLLPIPGPIQDIVISAFYILLIFVCVREQLGKLIFVILVLMDFGNLNLVASKCLEGFFFPEYALGRYRYTFSICMLPNVILLSFLVYKLVFKDICSGESEDDLPGEKQDSLMWRYLWIIPAIFYAIWMQHFYLSGRTALENALDPLSTGYLIVIDAGSLLIYHLIIRLVSLQRESRKLEAENHLLSIQKLQYDNLKNRIDETRRARHDMRHQLLLLRSIREQEDLSLLDELIGSFPQLSELDQALVYCENENANTILSYFAGISAKSDIRFDAHVTLPEELFIDKIHLAVLLGNLLENAVEAGLQREHGRFISISGGYKVLENSGNGMISLVVENSYSVTPRQQNGRFRSTKHSGDGVGIESVRSIATLYNGTSSFTTHEDIFTASVILYES